MTFTEFKQQKRCLYGTHRGKQNQLQIHKDGVIKDIWLIRSPSFHQVSSTPPSHTKYKRLAWKIRRRHCRNAAEIDIHTFISVSILLSILLLLPFHLLHLPFLHIQSHPTSFTNRISIYPLLFHSSPSHTLSTTGSLHFLATSLGRVESTGTKERGERDGERRERR